MTSNLYKPNWIDDPERIKKQLKISPSNFDTTQGFVKVEPTFDDFDTIKNFLLLSSTERSLHNTYLYYYDVKQDILYEWNCNKKHYIIITNKEIRNRLLYENKKKIEWAKNSFCTNIKNYFVNLFTDQRDHSLDGLVDAVSRIDKKSIEIDDTLDHLVPAVAHYKITDQQDHSLDGLVDAIAHYKIDPLTGLKIKIKNKK